MRADIVQFSGERFSLGFDKVYDISKSKKPAVSWCNEDELQRMLEKPGADIIVPAERWAKDHFHFRKSAINQVACKLAKKNKIAIGFSFNGVLKAKDRPLLLGRMMQNIRLCRKYGVMMVLASFAKEKYGMRSAEDLVSFGKSLGMTGKEAKDSLANAARIADRENEAAKGVKVVKKTSQKSSSS